MADDKSSLPALRRGLRENRVIDHSKNVRVSLREAIRAEIEPDGKGGYFRPSTQNQDLSTNSFGARFGAGGAHRNKLKVLEWAQKEGPGGANNPSSLRDQIEITFRSQDAVAEEISRVMGLLPSVSVQITRIPGPADDYQEIRGFLETHNQFLEKARLPFAIDYPLSRKRMYWVGGVTVDPTESPGLASALLDAVAQQPRQTIVFVDRYRLHEYVIATSRWLETEFEAPYHLYRVFCKGPRPAVRRIDQPFFDERVFSEVVKQLEQERHLQQRASAVVSDVTVIPTSEGESNE